MTRMLPTGLLPLLTPMLVAMDMQLTVLLPLSLGATQGLLLLTVLLPHTVLHLAVRR